MMGSRDKARQKVSRTPQLESNVQGGNEEGGKKVRLNGLSVTSLTLAKACPSEPYLYSCRPELSGVHEKEQKRNRKVSFVPLTKAPHLSNIQMRDIRHRL
jgi:hypothetical protein